MRSGMAGEARGYEEKSAPAHFNERKRAETHHN